MDFLLSLLIKCTESNVDACFLLCFNSLYFLSCNRTCHKSDYFTIVCKCELRYCEMHIKGNQTSLASFILIIQYIEDTKDPFWAGLATRVPNWCAKREWLKEWCIQMHALA